jgi:predicted transcriptional regulator
MRQTYSYLRIHRLRDSGRTWREICEALGCCEETIRRALTDDIRAFDHANNERQKKHRKKLCNGVNR